MLEEPYAESCESHIVHPIRILVFNVNTLFKCECFDKGFFSSLEGRNFQHIDSVAGDGRDRWARSNMEIPNWIIYTISIWTLVVFLGNPALNFSISWKGSQVQWLGLLHYLWQPGIYYKASERWRHSLFTFWMAFSSIQGSFHLEFSLSFIFSLSSLQLSLTFQSIPVYYGLSHSADWHIYFLRSFVFHSNSLITLLCPHVSFL